MTNSLRGRLAKPRTITGTIIEH